MGDDYEIDDLPCPKCGHNETRSRRCHEIGCNDGYFDEHDDDPINYAPGEELTPCDECHGTEIVRWCSKCGADYWLALWAKEKSAISPPADGEGAKR